MTFIEWREMVVDGLKEESFSTDMIEEIEDSIKSYFEEGLSSNLAVGVIYSDVCDPDEDEDDDDFLEVAEEDSLEGLAQPQDDEETIEEMKPEESKQYLPKKKHKGNRTLLSLDEQIKQAEERDKKIN